MMFAVVGTTISAAIVGGGLYALGVVSSTHCSSVLTPELLCLFYRWA